MTNFNQKRALTDNWSFFFLFFFVNIAVSLYLGFWLLQRYYIIKGGPLLGQNEKQTFICSFIWEIAKQEKHYMDFFSTLILWLLPRRNIPAMDFHAMLYKQSWLPGKGLGDSLTFLRGSTFKVLKWLTVIETGRLYRFLPIDL